MLTFLKNNSRSILLLLVAALIIWLYFWLFGSPIKSPVPTFQVSPGSIMVTPDKTLGADKVIIKAFNGEDGKELASGALTAPFDTAFNLSFDKNVALVRVEMEYSKAGKSIGRLPSDQAFFKIGPVVGVPIVALDVPMGRSGTNFTTINNWCDCAFGPTGVTDATQCPSPTTKNFRFAIGNASTSTGKYKVEVTKNTVVGGAAGTPEISHFILSVDNPALGVMNVLYYTNFNMTCESPTTLLPALSNDTDFSLLAFNKLLFYNTSALKYSCQVQKMVDCGTTEGERFIIVKCDDTPPPSGTTVNYSVSVTKANSACAPGGTL